jgi:hypothetical protein
MTLGIVLVLLLGSLGGAYVVAPLLRRGATEPEHATCGTLDGLRELHARHQALLASLKDLEDDRETDKLGDEDYVALKSRLTSDAIDVMRRLDEAEGERAQATERERRSTLPLQYPGGGRSDEGS